MFVKKLIAGITLFFSCAAYSNSMVIRDVQETDFPAIREMSIAAFASAYNLITKEQIDGLALSFAPTLAQELADFKNHRNTMISLVALCDNELIGFLSTNLTDTPNEVYGRYLAVAPAFQNKKIAIQLFKACRDRLPSLKRFLCLTRKTNANAQALYTHFGGKKVENPSWVQYLYKSSNPIDFVGYEFDETAITAFDSRFAEKTIHLVPPTITPHHVQEKVTCVRPKHSNSFQIYGEVKNDKLIVHNYGHAGAGWTQLFGSVAIMHQELTANLAKYPELKDKPIRVIGAGCMGLLSAIVLKEHGYDVSITAKELENLTSHKAAGIFFPSSMYAQKGDQAKCNAVSKISQQEYYNIIEDKHHFLTPAVARFMPVYVDRETDYSGLDFCQAPNLVTEDFGNGKRYPLKEFKTIFIDVVEMMKQLHNRIQENGITIQQKEVRSFDEVSESVIINCTGLGAQKLNADDGLIPVQGHLILLKDQPATEHMQYMIHTNVIQDGKEEWVYYVPKGSGLLGVTFVEGEAGLDTNAHEFDRMIQRASNFFGTPT